MPHLRSGRRRGRRWRRRRRSPPPHLPHPGATATSAAAGLASPAGCPSPRCQRVPRRAFPEGGNVDGATAAAAAPPRPTYITNAALDDLAVRGGGGRGGTSERWGGRGSCPGGGRPCRRNYHFVAGGKFRGQRLRVRRAGGEGCPQAGYFSRRRVYFLGAGHGEGCRRR